MSLIDAANTALSEFIRLHDLIEPCDGLETCPAAQAIKGLQDAINEMNHPQSAGLNECPLCKTPFFRPTTWHYFEEATTHGTDPSIKTADGD